MPVDSTLAEIAEVIRTKQRFVVISHIRPDGDALGCTIAMGLCLRQLGKDVQMWNDDGCVERFHFLHGSELVTQPPAEPQDFDVAIMLDTAVKERGGRCVKAVKSAGTWINLDHHVSNPRYGDLNFIDSTSPATGQILFELCRAGNLPLTYEMADSLFVAISTDTGSFQYPNTTARTYEIGAELVRLGVNVGTLSQNLYESHPRRRIELLKAMLNVMRFSSDDRVASIALPLTIVRGLGTKPDDTEGLIDHIRSIEGVRVAAFFEELPDGLVRVSLRSKDKSTDVCEIASAFGGGGHTL
ncbi:MAG: bifunctional oligoribonuclease/PAP phosphatase NrnA, partial [Chthoniobacteraceae bacterium]